MTEKIRFTSGVDISSVSGIRDAMLAHKDLADVVAWAAKLGRKDVVRSVLTQDEYTHDVTVQYESGIFLVYDVT